MYSPLRALRAAAVLATILLVTLVGTRGAQAFCGFYVAGADTKLYNNATMVVMMREGKRTVLSMQNNYQGPAEDFAMVVPVPVVLQKENVKTLPAAVFDRVDSLAAPRLVEYWEQDPCRRRDLDREGDRPGRKSRARMAAAPMAEAKKDSVKIEAQFVVGEYDIVVLSAQDSGGLETWLKDNKYNIPDGSEPLLRPYVQEGMKFFVAKVNSAKVKMENGQAKLSPLRFYYDDEKFRLPVRLGLINAKAKQDLIVHILAKGKRYEAANFENVTIPTNITVSDETRDGFAGFYAQLFDTTQEQNPKAVVTEYSWDAGSCDPCPVPALRMNELTTLGADAIKDAPPSSPSTPINGQPVGDRVPTLKKKRARRRPPRRRGNSFVLTRLHVRYDKNSLTEDIVFKPAEPIVGGREFMHLGKELERGSRKGARNNFQARYAMRHRWEGEVACENPVYDVWGGPPRGQSRKTIAAKDLAFATRGTKLASFVREEVKELGIKPDKPLEPRGKTTKKTKTTETPDAATGSGDAAPSGKAERFQTNCSLAQSPGGASVSWLAFSLAAAAALLAHRRRRG